MLNLLRLKRKTDASFSVDENGYTHLALKLPTGWSKLNPDQLQYICMLLANGVEMNELKHYCFLRFGHFKVVSRWGDKWIIGIRQGLFKRREFHFTASELAKISCRWLGWMDEKPRDLIRIQLYKKKYRAINAQLHGLRFKDFLDLENYWQGFIYTKDHRLLDRMVRIMYHYKNGNKIFEIPDVLRFSVLLWFGAWKEFCYGHWPNLYARSISSNDNEPVDVENVTNMQIRALTGGDITKEKEVLDMDVWRALTELDAKALDAKEQRRQIDSIKHKK